MAMNGLHNLLAVLETGANEIHVDPAVGKRARVCIQRMLDFARLHLPAMKGSGDA
jgi:quinolinate synthase